MIIAAIIAAAFTAGCLVYVYACLIYEAATSERPE